jgi:hypothetical protein
LPWQQPLQLLVVQVVLAWHLPVVVLQVLLVWVQSTQKMPPVPQAVLDLPPRHWLFLQQPLQVAVPQVLLPWHRPVEMLQVCPVRQAVQGRPPLPQAVLVGG